MKIILEVLNVKGNIYDIIEAYLKYNIKHYKIFEKECENQFDEYRDINVEEIEKYIDEKLSKLPIHHLIIQIKLDKILWDIDAVSLYPSTMWDENSVYQRIETGYACTEDMNDELVDKFNNGIFTKRTAI